MPDLPKYHLREQYATALLGPVAASLRDLERRAQHYLDRLTLGPADQELLRSAHRALATALADVERLSREGVAQTTQARADG